MKKETFYQKAVAMLDKNDIGNHESDLYLKCSNLSETLVNQYEFKSSVTRFTSQIDGCLWFDVPFAFDPFWEKKVS